MSSQSNKSTSWFARLDSTFRRKNGNRSSSHNRRGLRFESLETRSLLSATVLPSISGIVYQDAAGNGLTSDDARLANVTINLFRDGGDGVFEGKNAGSDDTQVGSAFSDASGKYKFDNLSTGTYFVQEVGVPGLVIAPGQNVQKVVVASSDLQGTTGTTIDSFSTTSQYVSGSLHGGKTGMSAQAAQDAIGGHRNLFAQLTSAKGSVSLGANSDFPGLLDFASGSASNGIFWINWDGNNNNAAVLNPTGLGQVDITSQGTSTGIKLTMAADHDNGFIMLKVFSDASNWSWASVPISNTADGSLNDSQFVPFSDFTVGGNQGGANFSKIGAIQLAINGANANDGQVGPILAAGPKVFSNINFANLPVDLALTKSAPLMVKAGKQLIYTLVATNNGPANATGVSIVDTLPTGTSYSSASGQSSATIVDHRLTLNVGNVAVGASSTIVVVVDVASTTSGTITNTATVTSIETDLNMLNNTAEAKTQVDVPIIPLATTDLRIDKSAPTSVNVGSNLIYTLVVRNNSLTTATSVTVVDTLPTGFAYLSAGGQISASISGNRLTLNLLESLASQASETITIVGTVTAAAASTITNRAVVSSHEADDNEADNTSSVVTTVVRPVTPPTKRHALGR